MEFKIDFLRPGRAFPKDTPVYRLKKRFGAFQKKAADRLIKRVGTSITTLVISFSVLIFSFSFFYMVVYLPRQTKLQELAQEIQQMETMVNSLRQKRKQEQTKRNMIKSRIKQLMNIKSDSVSWTDKLKAINRNLVKGLWLTSLEVKRKVLKPKQKPEDKKQRGRRRGKAKKEKQEPKKEEALPSQIKVSISGDTYAFLESRPLKLIAKFMTDLMKDPVWEKHFDLTDWAITTSKAKDESDGESAEGLKIVSFKLELERKR